MLKKFEAKVSQLSQKGLGIVTDSEGQKYLVEKVVPGDVGHFEEIPPLSKRALYKLGPFKKARLLELISSSEQRRNPPCPHFKECSGCPLMMLSYQDQLNFKQHRVEHALKRLNVSIKKLDPIKASPNEFEYRNRGQFKTDGKRLGYVDSSNFKIIHISECLVLSASNQQFLADCLQSLPQERWVPGEGFRWNFIDFDEETTVSNIVLNRRRPFKQGNSDQNAFMREWLSDKLKEISLNRVVVEFFSGSGNLTEIILKSPFEKVVAIEVQGSALEKLRQKNQARLKVIEADLFKSNIWREIQHEIVDAEVLVLDPPREGLIYQKAWFKVMPKIKTIIYISCEIETYAKDVKVMSEFGFEVEELVPLDLFPQTAQVEILSVLKKRN